MPAPFPPGLTLRDPVPADAPAVAELANAETMAVLGMADTTEAELITEWTAPRVIEGPRAVVVIDAAGRIVGYLSVTVEGMHHEEVFGFAVLPVDGSDELGDALVAEMEARAAWWIDRAGVPTGVLRVGALDGPGHWRDALARAGFRQTRRALLMRRPLTGDLEPPAWPDGIELRAFDRAAHALPAHGVLHAAFEDHYGPPFDDYTTWSHLMFVQPQRRIRDDLILVAWAGTEPIGVLVASEEAPESPGGAYVSDLGVLREHRRHGVGRALLLEAFARLRDLGRTEVVLNVDESSETNATSLYRGVGMREQPMYAHWMRTTG